MYQQQHTIDELDRQNIASPRAGDLATPAMSPSSPASQQPAANSPTVPLTNDLTAVRSAASQSEPYMPSSYYPPGSAVPASSAPPSLPEQRRISYRTTYSRVQRWNAMLSRIMDYLWFALAVLEVLLALRFFLRILAANPFNTFVRAVFGVTHPLIEPFATAFTNPASRGHVLELTTLLAIVIYGLIGIAIIRLLWLTFYRNPDTGGSE
jgi:hypothetical protein